MAAYSNIRWTTHTFNAWLGCTKVSPGCQHCYAEKGSKRNPTNLGRWGPAGSRKVVGEAKWREPLRWDRDAACTCGTADPDAHDALCPARRRTLVFCNSWSDVFEGRDTMPAQSWQPVQDARLRLFNLIAVTPNLHWQVLTKRPQNILPFKADAMARMTAEGAEAFEAAWRQRVWIGTSVEKQEWADIRIPELVKVDAAVRFLSLEPLLGPVNLEPWLGQRCPRCGGKQSTGCTVCSGTGWASPPQIGWVVIGGESGGHARPYDVAWPRDLIRQCEKAGVPVFHKQLGSNPFGTDRERWRMEGSPSDSLPENGNELVRLHVTKKGEEPYEWLPDLRVQAFPKRVPLQMA